MIREVKNHLVTCEACGRRWAYPAEDESVVCLCADLAAADYIEDDHVIRNKCGDVPYDPHFFCKGKCLKKAGKILRAKKLSGPYLGAG